MRKHLWTVEASSDHVTQQYTETFVAELARKPFDRQLLHAFADRVRDQGMVCDLGCGPGHVARYLKDWGVEVWGVDVSAAMVQCATQRHPDIPFHKGDMRALDFPPASFAGIAAFEFIPIKSLAAMDSSAPGSYAGHSRVPSRDHGPLASTGGSGPSRYDNA